MLNDRGMPGATARRGDARKPGYCAEGSAWGQKNTNREPRYGALATIRCENTLAKYVCRKTG